ncbi:MAG: phospho-N-acetylmuramoyl-pentapeptide-transferase [Candidatus Dependentiae bacterium]|nr:phospho-N-acetylmuramoyl-pentapeptide-transferase [Candidatus Dependentiae bacterium]
MLYHLSILIQPYVSALNIVHYVSFRAIMGLLSAFFMSIILGDRFIAFSRRFFQNSARPFTPESHAQKGLTPTMGGLFILQVVLFNLFMWCDLSRPEAWIFSLTLILFGLIGLLDDLYKIWYKGGISARLKMGLQLLCAFCVATSWVWLKNPSSAICVPLLKHINPELGLFFIPWIIFILVGTSNGVNLTDGLDGLACGVLLLNVAFFSGVSYLAGHYTFASYLQIPFAACSEAVVVGGVLFGAVLGFLWFNAHPAQIFMGDVGSLSLGAALAMMAIVSKQELLLPISGGIFVLEAMSVILQIASIKIFKRKLLKMAPIHHHFEMIGWKESKVTMRFGIITLILCLLAAAMFKVR